MIYEKIEEKINPPQIYQQALKQWHPRDAKNENTFVKKFVRIYKKLKFEITKIKKKLSKTEKQNVKAFAKETYRKYKRNKSRYDKEFQYKKEEPAIEIRQIDKVINHIVFFCS